MWKQAAALAIGGAAGGGVWAAFGSPCLALLAGAGAVWAAQPGWRRDHFGSFLRLQAVVALAVIVALAAGLHAPLEIVRWAVLGGLCVSLLHSLMVGASRFKSRTARWACVAGMAVILGLPPVLATIHPPRKRITHTPAAVGLPFQTIALRTDDGVDLRGWEIVADAPRAAVVYSHGFGENRAQSLSLLRTLHDLDCAVVAVDFRGHGESGGSAATFGFRETRDIRAACDYVAHRYGDTPLLLVGVSYGAAVTLQTAPQLHNVRGIWVDSPFARLDDLAERRFGWLPGPVRHPLLRAYYMIAYLDTGIVVDRVKPEAALQDLAVPIAWTHALDDTLIPIEQCRGMYAAYQGDKRCYWVGQATHWNLQAVAGSAYQSRLRAFVDDVLSPASPRQRTDDEAF